MTKWQTLISYRPGRLGQNTLLSAAGLGARGIIQAIYLLYVSRWLGADSYGLFAGSVALASLGTPLGNWGSAFLLPRYIGQDRSHSRAMWATALVQTCIVGGFLVFFILLVSTLLFSQSLPFFTLLLLAISELLLLPACHAASSQCYALERGIASAISVCLAPLARTIITTIAIAGGIAATPEHASWCHFGGTLLGLAAAVFLVFRIDGLPAWNCRLPLNSAVRQGTPYAISSAAGVSYQEVDKVLMLQILGAASVGPYTASFRVASIFTLPVSALVSAALPRLIAEKNPTNRERTQFAMWITLLGYGILAGILMMIAAPFITAQFGPGYDEIANHMALLAFWPLLFGLRQYFSIQLTAINRQNSRATVEVFGLILITLLNVAFLPHLGVKAAILALLIFELTTSLIFLTIIKYRIS